MFILTPIIAIILSVFSTAVMSYIAMATPIGPWIAPTLVLTALLIFKLVTRSAAQSANTQQADSAGSLVQDSATQSIVLVTLSGSIGGILATGVGFSFPTLYFLDPVLFNQWMASPLYFTGVLGSLACAAGAFGMLLANLFEYQVQDREHLSFPISLLVHKMIVAGNQLRKAYELAVGFVATTFFCLLQDGIGGFKGYLPKTFVLTPSMVLGGIRIPLVSLDIWPMLWAIGFITGHLIAIPLAAGAISRIFIVDLLNQRYFSHISSVEFTFAFCSGMVLVGVFESLLRLPNMIRQLFAWIRGMRLRDNNGVYLQKLLGSMNLGEQAFLCIVASCLLMLSGFSMVQVVYLLVLTTIFTYQMVEIAGKWGIAPLGRFATFVMLPAMFFFSLDIIRIVYIALFVEVCGGVAVDILFGRGLAKRSDVDTALVKRYQYLGLSVSVLTIGIICWMLIKACPLGSAQLFAYKAQSRHLLINALLNGKEFSWIILAIGALFSLVLAQCGLNAMLVLGGLLMPLNLSLGLIFGGMLTYLVRDRQEWEPFWSGVFAANSVWMLLKAVL